MDGFEDLPRILTALRYSGFRRVWTGNFLSNIGTWMQNVAQGWLVLQLTDSALWLGITSFAAAAPMLMFTLIGGVIADQIDRRKMLMVSQAAMMASALALALLTYAKWIKPWHVAALAFATGVSASLAAPAQQALVPMLVPRQHLTNAIGLNSAQFNLSRVLGPTAGGFCMAWFGPAGNFLLNSLSFAALMIALAGLRWQEMKSDPGSIKGARVALRLREGFAYVWRGASMRLLVMLVSVTALMGVPYFSFVPVFARDVLHVGERGLGLLMAFSGLGSFFAALTIAYLGNPKRRGAVMAMAGIVFFAAIIGFSFSRLFAVSAALQFVAGYAMILLVALINTRLQHSSSEEMRGRTMSIYATAYLGLPPLGSLAAGAMSTAIGTSRAIAAMAAAGMALFLTIFGVHRELREME